MPVSQPSEFLSWDTNNDNILPIPSPVRQEGWVPGEAVPSEYLNYALQLLDLWVQFLQQQTSSNGGYTTIIIDTTLTTTYASYFCDVSGGSIIVTLPSSAIVPGQLWRIKNTEFGAAHTVTVRLANAANTLEGTTNGTVTLNDGEVLVVQSDGAGKYLQMTP